MRLIRQLRVRVAVPFLDDHPSSYVVRDFIEALVRQGVQPIQIPRRVGSVMARFKNRIPRLSPEPVVVPLMGTRFDTLAAASIMGPPIPFCWDVWQPEWAIFTKFLGRFNPPLVVTTAKQSADHLRTTLDTSVVAHLPEAINIARYDPGRPLSARSVDVLELGRRNPRWHESIRVAAKAGSVEHRYEREPGAFVFPDEQTLVAGLADSKISVCFPSNITHPKRSGSVSTITSRYLESMASRCLVLGETPQELPDLLGFDPTVRADMAQPWPQLLSVLASVDAYQAQVDEAYERVRAVGGWDFRVRQLLEMIRAL